MMHIFFFALLKFNQKQYFRKIKTIINEKIKQKNMDYNSFSEFDEVYFLIIFGNSLTRLNFYIFKKKETKASMKEWILKTFKMRECTKYLNSNVSSFKNKCGCGRLYNQVCSFLTINQLFIIF